MKEFICLTVFIILSMFLAIAMIVCGFICQFKQQSAIKSSTYECGIKPITESNIQFDVKYFNYAILFLIFDIETIFLYPFAMFVNALGIFVIIEAFIFILLLLLGLYFGITKKMLRWI